jgi:hypothetical protein
LNALSYKEAANGCHIRLQSEELIMSLAGKGAVAIWHDIAAEGRTAFYQWHGLEHMPERVGIAGFLRGRRYVSVDGNSPEYFNLYETESTATLTGADYLARLNDPTPWTVATAQHFRSVARSLCAVAGSQGEGQGGLIATFRYAIDDVRAQAHRQQVSDTALPQFAQLPGIAGAHLLIADEGASAVETAEKKLRREKNLIPRWIVLIESWGDLEPFTAQCRQFAQDPVFAGALSAPVVGVYRLQNCRAKFSGGAT